MSAFDQIRDVYFGSARAPVRLSPEGKQRVLWTSAAPAVVVIAVLLNTALAIIYEPSELLGGPFGGQAPFLWGRLYSVSQAVMILQFLAVALLFAAGLQPWSRAEGSWMILIGTALATVALACAAFVIGTHAVLDREDFHDVRTDLWTNIAGSFSLMSIGYFFLAYRGSGAPEELDEVTSASDSA